MVQRPVVEGQLLVDPAPGVQAENLDDALRVRCSVEAVVLLARYVQADHQELVPAADGCLVVVRFVGSLGQQDD